MKIYILRYLFLLIIFIFCLLISKADLISVINRGLPFSEAGILAGMVLGERSGFEKEFYNKLITSGLVHLVVVSGSNVMLLIGGGIEYLASKVGRKWAIAMGLILGWRYVILVGWEIPIVRAMLLLSILYLAQLVGRKYNLWRGLILMVSIMFLGEPLVFKSVSFWMSIMSFMGIVTFKNIKISKTNFFLLVSSAMQASAKGGFRYAQQYLLKFRDIFLETVWVNVWILPIIAMIFGKVSIISPVTNVMVLVLVEFITMIGVVGSLLGIVWFELGRTVLWILIPSLKYLEMVVGIGGGINSWQVKFNWWMLAGYYMILIYFLIRKGLPRSVCNDKN